MLANYHTHTWRCKHAEGTEVQYIESAVKNGIKILGFSDHSPYFFPDGYQSRIRMAPEQLPGYVAELNRLRREFQDKIEIHIGLEAEYFPDLFPELLDFLRINGIEYLILGQHRLGNGVGDFYCGWETDDEALLRRYCAQCAEAMKTGLFTYFAHPDIFNFTGSRELYVKYMSELCKTANSCRMPLEINLAGLEAKLHYPRPLFWEIAANEGCKAVLGIDAHEPGEFNSASAEKKILTFAADLGLEILPTVRLKQII